jgi:hypothetical protein
MPCYIITMLPPLLHPSPHSASCLSIPYGSSSRIRLAKTSLSLTMRRRRGIWRSRPGSAVLATSEESVATVSTDDDKVRLGLDSFSEGICCGPPGVVVSVFSGKGTAAL